MAENEIPAKKQFIKELKNKTQTHYNNWLDNQLMTIENSLDDMKMFQAKISKSEKTHKDHC